LIIIIQIKLLKLVW